MTSSSSSGPGPDPGPDETPVENESVDCEVAALPDAGALPKISKLPDPFTKVDGTRVSTKAEWHCRRQEIRKQAEKYIYGEKPTPDVVTGTVTENKVSVHVEAQGKQIDFGLNWLSNNFEPFVFKNNVSNAVKLPIDTHALIARMAPRGLLVLEDPHQAQMGAPAGHTATVAGAEVYKALGVEKNVSYHSKVSDTAHCSYKNEYTDLLVKNITKFLKHEGEAPGEFVVGSGGSLSMSDWVDWQAPTLE